MRRSHHCKRKVILPTALAPLLPLNPQLRGALGLHIRFPSLVLCISGPLRFLKDQVGKGRTKKSVTCCGRGVHRGITRMPRIAQKLLMDAALFEILFYVPNG